MRKVKSLLKQTTPLQIGSAPFLNSPENSHTFFLYEEHERAVESSQRVKEEEITIITIGVASPSTNEEVLQTIASSKEQFLLFPQVGSAARVDLSSDEITEMICKGEKVSITISNNLLSKKSCSQSVTY